MPKLNKPILKKRPIRLKGKAYKDLQIAVLKRDNFTCKECARYTNSAPHHIVFRSQGGSDTMENLRTLCIPCHARAHGRIVK